MAQLEKELLEPKLRPKYLQVKRDLSQSLRSCQFEAGLQLPSEKELANSNGVSIGTIRQALSAMEKEGLIRREQGRGTFVNASAINQEARTDQSNLAMEAFAIIVPEVNGFYPSLVKGFDEVCNELNHPTILCNTDNDISKQANFLMRLIDRRISGVAINTSTLSMTPAYQIRQVQQASIPVVLLRRGVEGISAPLFVSPSLQIGEMAGREIGKRGHRRVAYFAGERYSTSELYEQGLRNGLAEHGIDLPPECVHYTSHSHMAYGSEGYYGELKQSIIKILRAKNRPTAIFTGFDTTAEMIYVVAARLKISVPDDLYIVSYSHRRRESAIQREIAAVTKDERAVGRLAAEVLNEMKIGKRPIGDETQFSLDLEFYPGLEEG